MEAVKAPRRGSVQNVRLKWNQMVIGQVGDISCWVITILQLCGELATILKQVLCGIRIQKLLLPVGYAVVNDYCFCVCQTKSIGPHDF